MTKSFYEILGPEGLRKLVTYFYEGVFNNQILIPLFDPAKRTDIEEKQFLFLGQLLGGPMAYTEKHGHPKMRMRHMPHKITPEAAEQWLACMARAIGMMDELTETQKDGLYSIFPRIASHMINTEN